MKNEPKTETVKHTPGPWAVGTDCKVWGSGKPNCYKSEACFVAACGNDQDAALIAAAPELLAACVAALPLLEEYRQRVFTGRIRGDLLSGDYEPTQALRAAIAKAEGRDL